MIPDSCLMVPPLAGRLSDLQLRVARRADELARGFHRARGGDRMLWLRAEQEIFELAESEWHGLPAAVPGH
jgi:hypothetical protein